MAAVEELTPSQRLKAEVAQAIKAGLLGGRPGEPATRKQRSAQLNHIIRQFAANTLNLSEYAARRNCEMSGVKNPAGRGTPKWQDVITLPNGQQFVVDNDSVDRVQKALDQALRDEARVRNAMIRRETVKVIIAGPGMINFLNAPIFQDSLVVIDPKTKEQKIVNPGAEILGVLNAPIPTLGNYSLTQLRVLPPSATVSVLRAYLLRRQLFVGNNNAFQVDQQFVNDFAPYFGGTAEGVASILSPYKNPKTKQPAFVTVGNEQRPLYNMVTSSSKINKVLGLKKADYANLPEVQLLLNQRAAQFPKESVKQRIRSWENQTLGPVIILESKALRGLTSNILGYYNNPGMASPKAKKRQTQAGYVGAQMGMQQGQVRLG